MPAIFDLSSVLLMMAGLSHISASMWMLLRGGCIVFVALMKQFALGDKLTAQMWVGVLTITLAVVLVGSGALVCARLGGGRARVRRRGAPVAVAQRAERGAARAQARARVVGYGAARAKVGQLDVAALAEEHVLGLEVGVHEARVMHARERGERLGRDEAARVLVERAVRRDVRV